MSGLFFQKRAGPEGPVGPGRARGSPPPTPLSQGGPVAGTCTPTSWSGSGSGSPTSPTAAARSSPRPEGRDLRSGSVRGFGFGSTVVRSAIPCVSSGRAPDVLPQDAAVGLCLRPEARLRDPGRAPPPPALDPHTDTTPPPPSGVVAACARSPTMRCPGPLNVAVHLNLLHRQTRDAEDVVAGTGQAPAALPPTPFPPPPVSKRLFLWIK